MSSRRITEWENKKPQEPTVQPPQPKPAPQPSPAMEQLLTAFQTVMQSQMQPVAQPMSMVSQQVGQMLNQMSNVEERLGAHGADIRNLRDSITQLDKAFHNQSTRLDLKHVEVMSSINGLKDDIRRNSDTTHEKLQEMSSRVDELEHARTYSSGVLRTVKGLVAAVMSLFAALAAVIAKQYFNN